MKFIRVLHPIAVWLAVTCLVYSGAASSMSLRNSWYVDAWGSEFGPMPLACSFADQPVLLFRTTDAQAVALEGRARAFA